MAPTRGAGGEVRLPPMNALEILRETVRVLRGDPHAFTSILFLLLCPASGCLLLSAAALDGTVVLPLARRLLVAAAASGLAALAAVGGTLGAWTGSGTGAVKRRAELRSAREGRKQREAGGRC